MMKLTKIVATISDKNCSPEFIKELHDAGMNVVRLNTAHQSPAEALKVVDIVRKVSEKIPILIDTKGPEIRTTASEVEITVAKGDVIRMEGNPQKATTKECVYVNLASFVECLNVGSRIMIDDGELELIVIEKNTDHLLVRAQNPGTVKARKSINLPGTKVNLPSLSDKDRDFIRFAIENDIDFIAHSFVRNKEDVMAIQCILDEQKSPIKIIAKIENQEGVDNIDEILPHVYGIMVARGDLAIEVPAEKIPVIQNRLVKKCIRQKKAVIIATQMLHSMIKNPRPTRAEITDIANAVFTGTDAIMLSGETAYGDYPIEAVKTMTRTVIEVESSTTFNISEKIAPHDNEISVYLAKTAVKAVEKLNARAIITDTDTGKTARYISAFRGRSPIFAQCYSKRVMRELALNFGIYSDYMTVETSKNQFIRTTLSSLLDKKYLSPDALVAVLAGNFGKKTGPSFVEISTAGNMIASEKL